ncbi:glycosyltransferase family 2 protein [Hyunsoonleella ulvae]|uniref:glycosyltransferase family 2 protein n=1 Tax=Hyunsoonleella ulvae TaxID=2799948 RepID=UPI00193AA2C2|nr:glycosyltransferase family 2 protein [Hyunsoonleella ulvae]
MKQITIFTPTYNRAYCLHQCYESLLRQTNKDFKWLIIDDGSNDNTKELIKSWIDEQIIEIIYHYQENQGMHGAHNTAYSLIDTELNVCIDSDDFMPDNAVKDILGFWNKLSKSEKESVAGIVGLDADKNNNIIGNEIPPDITKTTLYDLYEKHKIYGDKKLVYRTEIVNSYPNYPLFEGERFVPLGYKYLLIDQDYELLTLNKPLCIVEYMLDGSSLNIFHQYKRHPKGFAFSRISEIQYGRTFSYRFKKAIHYVANNLMFGNFSYLKKAPRKLTVLLATIPGVLLYLYILIRTRKKK